MVLILINAKVFFSNKMKFNLSKVEFSNKDIKNKITIPKKLTPELAYFIGIHLGDGCLSFKKKKYDKELSYSGHIIDEYTWYVQDIISLIKRIFNKTAKFYENKGIKGKSINVYFRSKAIFIFLNKVIGLQIGSKNNMGIPECIKNSNQNIKSAFIRGLADTDFCLTFKKRHKNLHYYPVIALSTCNKKLVKELEILFKEFELNCYTLLDYPTERKGTKLTTNQLQINGVKRANIWMNKIGFSSPKHLTKYLVWKKHNFCPPNTNLIQRKEILNGKLDINKFYQPKHF